MITLALLSLATITAPDWELFELEAPTEARSLSP